jgi:hypothetical protein
MGGCVRQRTATIPKLFGLPGCGARVLSNLSNVLSYFFTQLIGFDPTFPGESSVLRLRDLIEPLITRRFHTPVPAHPCRTNKDYACQHSRLDREICEAGRLNREVYDHAGERRIH